MSLVYKIPPMISALAFGYGVGMAAPDAAITPVRAAVAAYQQPGAAPPGGAGAQPVRAAVGERRGAGQGSAGTMAARPAGAGGDPAPLGGLRKESRELGRLREVDTRGRREDQGEGEACSLDRPTYSQPPRYASTPDGYADDVDDLDTTGSEALSRLQMPDLPLTITRRTIKYVRFFTRTDRGRGMLETWLKRSGRHQDMIQLALREWRLPEDLIWLAMIESGFDERARSPAGAVGLWQFMPATGEVYGLAQNRYIDQRKNPRLATQAAAHHLRDLHQRFGDWNLALAAYNMGYEQLLSAIDRYGTADFNELARQGALPQETASYVPKIAAAALVANNLERFGFDAVKVSRPLDAAEIAAPPGTPLRLLAKAAGVSTATLRTLNPDLLQEKVPPGRGDYLVMVPAEALARAQASLPALLDSEPLVNDAAVLNPVDLLGGRDFAGRTRAPSEEGSLLSLLPKPKRRSLRDPLDELARPDDGDDGGDDEDIAPRRRTRSRRPLVMYKVGPGDTLIGVARQFAVDVEDLARENGLDPDSKLREGALIRLRARPELLERVGQADRAAPPGAAADGAAAAEPSGAPRHERPAPSDKPREGAAPKETRSRGRKGRS